MSLSPEVLLVVLVTLPGALFLGLGTWWLMGGRCPERILSRLSGGAHALLVVVCGTIAWWMWRQDIPSVRAELGDWFTVSHYGFPLSLLADRLSLPFAGLTVALVGVAGAFSTRYLHRDPGFTRFFLLLHLFTFGALLVFTAGSLDLLIAGWEVVGITSVMLVGFFHYRRDPVRNALRVFATYRVADLSILIAVFLMHHWFGTAAWNGVFTGEWPGHANNLDGTAASVIAVLLVLAASGKSSQGPFCGWLPRAMEGPTPSSAVFYGAIAVHAGPYLLLRIEPLLRRSPVATGLVILIGLTTALIASLTHRTSTDAKTSLAYAAQTQLGLIFAEIGMGWTTLAMVHVMGHAIVRTAQFLRAPSMLHDDHRVRSAAGGHLRPGARAVRLLPSAAGAWLYRVGLGRGFYDALVDRFVVAPVQAAARFLGVFERAFPGDRHAPAIGPRDDGHPSNRTTTRWTG